MRELTYCKNVDRTHDESDDTCCDDHTPERQTKALLTCGFLVHIAQDAVAEEDHSKSEHDEARTVAEQRPVARDI